jgi:uncharacterized protein (TIGR00369 family)
MIINWELTLPGRGEMDNRSAMPSPGPGTLPWTKSCFVCGEENPHGLHLKSRLEDGLVVLDFVPREADVGWRHTVHGGITMALLDEVMTWASIVALQCACVAAEITTRLKKPMLPARRFRVEGRVVKANARLALAEGEIRDEGNEVCAVASGKYVAMSSEQFTSSAQDFVVGCDTLRPDQIFTKRRA